MRIVLIDPDRRFAPRFDRLLAAAGHDVALVEQTAGVLEAVRRQATDLVLVAAASGDTEREGVLGMLLRLQHAGYAGPVLVVSGAARRAVR